MLNDKKDIIKIVLIFKQPNFWVVVMETGHLLYRDQIIFSKTTNST